MLYEHILCLTFSVRADTYLTDMVLRQLGLEYRVFAQKYVVLVSDPNTIRVLFYLNTKNVLLF